MLNWFWNFMVRAYTEHEMRLLHTVQLDFKYMQIKLVFFEIAFLSFLFRLFFELQMKNINDSIQVKVKQS